jgi:HEPN domain-containing protein
MNVNNQQNTTTMKHLNKTNMKTAIEWLVDYIKNLEKYPYKTIQELEEQAKEMEKEQIISVYWDAYNEGKYSTDKTAEQYYNETFKQE